MNANFELSSMFEFILILFFGVQVLYTYFTLGKKVGKIQTFPFFVWCNGLLLGVACMSLLFVKLDQFDFLIFEKLMRGLLGLFFANMTALISFLSIQNLTSKKIKTLWRLPFIGFFAGIYFELQYVKIICLGYFLIDLIILYLNRKYMHMVIQYFWVWVIPIAYLFYMNSFSLIQWTLLWLVLSGSLYKLLELSCIKSITFKEGISV